MIIRIGITLAVVLTCMMGTVTKLHVPVAGATRLAAPAHDLPLFQADWSKGLGGWGVYRGFAASNGMLTFDGAGDDGAFAPFRLNGLQNFAVEATIQLGAPTKPKQDAFDLFARRSITQQKSGIMAGYDAFAGESTATNAADLYWSSDRSYYAPGAALKPDTAAHIYRLEVEGNLYRFLIDGRVMVPWTAVKLRAVYDQVGLSFTYIAAQVKAFAVFALPATADATPLDANAVLARALPSGSISQPSTGVIFRDNSRYAIDNQVSLAAVQSSGRIYGLVQNFSDNDTFVQQSLNVHSSAAGAASMLTLFAARSRLRASKAPNYREVDAAALGIGDASFAYSYQYLYQGSPSYVFLILFQRGDYYITIKVNSANQKVAHSAVTLAQQADKLVQGQG